MVAPSGGKEIRPLKPPAWLLDRARVEAARMSHSELTRKLHNAEVLARNNRSSPKQVFTKNPAQAPAKQSLQRLIAEQRKSVKELTQPETIEEARVATQFKEVRRSIQVKDRDDRRAKKKKVREGQAMWKTGQSSRSEVPLPPIIAESSLTSSTPQDSMIVAEPVNDLSSRNPSPILTFQAKYTMRSLLPQWYTSITESSFMMKEYSKRKPQALAALDALKISISRCEGEKKNSLRLNGLYEGLRDHIHKAEIMLKVDKYIVKKSRLLVEHGLPRIFREDSDFPSDLKADAYQLYNRWIREDFEQDILRGIVTVKGKDRNGDKIDRTYRAKYPTSAKFYGEGDFVLGQWWPTQLCTVRDGAHGSTQGGIYGETEKGAYSIVLSGGGYHDEDHGNVIEYSGTEGKNFEPTENTVHLITSCELGNPIRVIRSSQLSKKNKYRPELGLRYDGLYQVQSYRLTDKEKATYRFRLKRCAGQDPIRYEDNAARRPTFFELREFQRLKAKIW